jgi:hypothetical protein
VAGIDYPSATSVKAIVASAQTRSTQKIYEELIDRAGAHPLARHRISEPF